MRERKPFRRIDVEFARTLVDRSVTLVLDMRDIAAFETAHVERARHLAQAELVTLIASVDKNRPILIYCYRGAASLELAQTFSDFGFQEVYSLVGGYDAWAARKFGPLSATLSRWLVDHGFPAQAPNAVIGNLTNPLMRAAHLGAVVIVRDLVAAGVLLNVRNADGNTALWFACVSRCLPAIEALAESGADLDNRNDNGVTVLMYAASAGLPTVVETLLARGADDRLETLDGFSALDMASTIECLTLLRRARLKRA